MMKLGYLKIPKIEIIPHSYDLDIYSEAHVRYAKLIENSDTGIKILKEIEQDRRVKDLEGHMISSGRGGYRFTAKNLSMWLLWAINEYGQETAEQNLNKFLDSSEITVINTLWVLGIQTKDEIVLDNDIRIMPIHLMPDSSDKAQYLRHDIQIPFSQSTKPNSAIIQNCSIKKAFRSDAPPERAQDDKQFWESTDLLHQVSILLNAMDGISCIPYFSTSYTQPEMPMGFFSGSSGGYQQFDVLGSRSNKINQSNKENINLLLAAFLSLPNEKKGRMLRVLSRLSQAKRREQIEDKILDLSIALEMMLLKDNKNNDQLSLTFRLRGAWLIGENTEDREKIYKQLRDIYNYRSQVAHSGILCKNDLKKINNVRESFNEYLALAEKIARKLIMENDPDWSRLVLGCI